MLKESQMHVSTDCSKEGRGPRRRCKGKDVTENSNQGCCSAVQRCEQSSASTQTSSWFRRQIQGLQSLLHVWYYDNLINIRFVSHIGLTEFKIFHCSKWLLRWRAFSNMAAENLGNVLGITDCDEPAHAIIVLFWWKTIWASIILMKNFCAL